MKLDEHKSLGFLANFIGRHGHRYFEKKFSEYGLHRGSIFVLKQLYRKDGQRQNDLVRGMELNKANVARLLEKLQSSGYVTRKKDKSDNRANRVYLTAKAREIKTEFDKIFTEWSAILTLGMDIDEQNQARGLLIKMCNNCIAYFEGGDNLGTTEDIIR